jgi:hypothetical protein
VGGEHDSDHHSLGPTGRAPAALGVPIPIVGLAAAAAELSSNVVAQTPSR